MGKNRNLLCDCIGCWKYYLLKCDFVTDKIDILSYTVIVTREHTNVNIADVLIEIPKGLREKENHYEKEQIFYLPSLW